MRDFTTLCVALAVVNLTTLLFHLDKFIPGQLILKLDFFVRKLGSTLLLMLYFGNLGFGFISTCFCIALYWVAWCNRFYLLAIMKGGFATIAPIVKDKAKQNVKMAKFISFCQVWEEKALKSESQTIVSIPEEKGIEENKESEQPESDNDKKSEEPESDDDFMEQEGNMVDVDL